MTDSHMWCQRVSCPNILTKPPVSTLILSPTTAVTPKVNSMKVQSAVDTPKSKVTLSEGLTCVDFQPLRNTLAIGCTKVVHVLEVKAMTEEPRSPRLTCDESGRMGGREGESHCSTTPCHSSGRMGLRQCGTFSNISKVEAVAWYPHGSEDVLAFVQRSRNITILFDTLLVRANRRVTKQWIHKSQDRCLISSLEAGSCLSNTAVVNVTSTSSTPLFGGASTESPHLGFQAKRDRGGRGMVEVVIPTGHIHVERILWDPHNAYTLALTSDATHFELWHIPASDECVYVPRLMLRPPAHDERSTSRSIAFSPSDPNLIVVAVEVGNAGKVIVYDRRHVEVPCYVTTMGPCFAASFHPIFSDLLAVCCRKTKTKTDSRVQFFQVMEDTQMGNTLRALANATGGGSLPSTGVSTGWPVVGQAFLPPIDTVDPLNRLRWRPSLKRSDTWPMDSTVDSMKATIDKISSQLWFATTSVNGQEVSVWDASNVFCPIFSIKSVSSRRNATQCERTLREPTDCVWVNSLTLVCIFKDGEVELTTLTDEDIESKKVSSCCVEDTTTATSDASAYKEAESNTFSLVATLPTSVVVPDFFGQCLVVRNTSLPLREYYSNTIRADKGRILDQMRAENHVELDNSLTRSTATASGAASPAISVASSSTGLGCGSHVFRDPTRATLLPASPADQGHSPHMYATFRHSQAQTVPLGSGISGDRSRSPLVSTMETAATTMATSVADTTGRRQELLFPLLALLSPFAHAVSAPSDNLHTAAGGSISSRDTLESELGRENIQEERNRSAVGLSVHMPVQRGTSNFNGGNVDAGHEGSVNGDARMIGARLGLLTASKPGCRSMPIKVPYASKGLLAETVELVLPTALQPHDPCVITFPSLVGSGSDNSKGMLSNHGHPTGSCKSSEILNSPVSDLVALRPGTSPLVEHSANGREISPGSPGVSCPVVPPKHPVVQLPSLGLKSYVNPVIEHHIISSDVPTVTYVEQLSEHDTFVRYAMDWDVGYDVARSMRTARCFVDSVAEYAERGEQRQRNEVINKRQVDKCFAKIMAHNAKVCFAHESARRFGSAAPSGEDAADTRHAAETAGLCINFNSSRGSSADIRGRLWASASEAWRNHNVPHITSHTALLLDYASLDGDVQFCAVLYLLFCLWWKQRHTSLIRYPCPLLSNVEVGFAEERGAQSHPSIVVPSDVGGCTPQRWRLRALQWVEQYVSRLYAMKLHVPINELLLVVPDVFGDSNPGLPRSEEIAQKLFTCVYCGTCRKTEIVPHHTMKSQLGSVAPASSELSSLGRREENNEQVRSEYSSDDCTEMYGSSGGSTPLTSLASSCSYLGYDRKEAQASVADGRADTAGGTKPATAALCTAGESSKYVAVASRNAVCRSCYSHSLMTCVICEEVVEGMYMWLRCCGHGGHVQHIKDWLSMCNECPACGVAVMIK